MLVKFINKVKRKLGIPILYPSETSKIRHLVINYCNGYGCDIGFGGDKIMKEKCDGIDYANPYAYTGKDKVDIICNVMNDPIPVKDNRYDYVYSSHLIEDFVNTNEALIKFIRILKSNGNLILVFPDQKKYEQHCKKTGQPLNIRHIHKEMGLSFMLKTLNSLPDITFNILYKSDCEIDYNVVLITKITKKSH